MSKKVLLADLDPLIGTVAFLLKRNSNYSFIHALTSASRLDETLWRGMVTSCRGVDVLLSPETPPVWFMSPRISPPLSVTGGGCTSSWFWLHGEGDCRWQSNVMNCCWSPPMKLQPFTPRRIHWPVWSMAGLTGAKSS
jgi:hypothetical protein